MNINEPIVENNPAWLSDSSLWPKYMTWMDSPCNAGYWTEQNEVFYQRRRAEIRSGTAELKTARQWKTALKQGGPDAKQFQRSMREIYEATLFNQII